MRKELFRIIDANFNRSREGLRVCEEIARFILNSPGLTRDLKAVRHRISDIVKEVGVPSAKAGIVEARDSEGDVGRCSRSASEMERLGFKDIFVANMERAKESLRVLEEFFKLIDRKVSVKFARIRFRVYDIEKKSLKKISSLRNTG